jgi:hypothetical protein
MGVGVDAMVSNSTINPFSPIRKGTGRLGDACLPDEFRRAQGFTLLAETTAPGVVSNFPIAPFIVRLIRDTTAGTLHQLTVPISSTVFAHTLPYQW